jgi:hypothetical protein
MVSVRCAESNWRTGLALGGLIAALLLHGAALAANPHNSGHGSAPAKNAAQQPPPPAPPTSAQTPEPYVYPYSCERPKNAEQDNLCIARQAADAARRQIVWAERTFWLGVVGIPLVTLTLGATAIAAWASHRQSLIARKTLSASLRPWVKAELVLCGPIVWTDQGGSIMLVVKMVNVGNVPALGVDIEVEARSPMEGDLPAEQIAFAD